MPFSHSLKHGARCQFNANDIGILNFALLLEELEAAFYTGAVKSRKLVMAKNSNT